MKYTAVDATELQPFDESTGARKPVKVHVWKRNVKLGCIAASTIFAFNLGLLIWSLAGPHHSGSDGAPGARIVFSGSCSRARNITLWAHLAINILGSLLLAASNHCMQCLTAPTREEIDQAHSKYKWLDVGVQSVRNIKAISPQRQWLWALLGLSSLPLHLLYNSVIFEAKVVNAYVFVATSNKFVTGGFWNSTRVKCFNNEGFDPGAPISFLQQEVNSLTKLDNAACLQAYGQDLISGWANVILVTNASTSDSVLNVGLVVFESPGNYDGTDSFVCDGNSRDTQGCGSIAYPANWTIFGSANPGITSYEGEGPFVSPYCEMLPSTTFQIEHCLAQKTPEACHIGIAPGILGAVLVCNLMKAICLFWTFRRLQFEPLVTLGDTIASFLERPDATTVGCGAISATDMKRWNPYMDRTAGFIWRTRSKNGFGAATVQRWVICTLLFILFWVIALVLLLRVGLAQFRNDGLPTTLRSLAANGLGHLNVNDMVYAGWLPDTILGNIILANTPQLLISLLYLLYNDLFTRMHLSAQWSSYSRVHKLLRVLNPTRGAGSEHLQKRNYFLSLPLRVAIPLLVVITVLHWLVSQSIFFAMIGVNDYASPGATTANPSNGGYPVLGCGWSPFALSLFLILGGLTIVGLGVAAVAFRYGKNMPLARSCSAAISAACHPPEWETDAAVRPLMYGVIEEAELTEVDGRRIPGHVGFTSGPVTPLVNGDVYR